MPNPPAESPMETFWRSTIMLGTLVVGGMGLYLYGPSAEKAAEIVDQIATRVQELVRTQASPPQALAAAQTEAPRAALASPFPGRPGGEALKPFSADSLAETSPASPESYAAPPLLDSSNLDFKNLDSKNPDSKNDVASRSRAPASDLAAVRAELTQLGAEGVVVEPWGSGGELYRIQFSAPVAGDAGFQRQFDAIRATPTEAATVALADLRKWRTGRRQPINR